MSRFLYRTDIPSAALEDPRGNQRRQLAELGLLNGGAGTVESISSSPGEQRLAGAVGGQFAQLAAAEIEELFASDLDAVPFASTDGVDSQRDGYYALRDVEVRRASSQDDRLQRYDGTLVKKGTQASKVRAVELSTGQVDHPFGNDDRALVGVPADADGVRWYNAETGATAEPTVVATRSADLGNVDLVDAQSAPYSDPTLIYEVGYDEGQVDVLVADTKGRADETSPDGQYQWQRVYLTDHTFTDGAAVLENGLVRVSIDKSASSLTVERWDGSGWSGQALGTSDWEFSGRFDIREIGLAQVRARIEFADETQSPTEYYPLDCWITRGYEDPLWGEIDGQGGTPTGLADLLDPVASELIKQAGAAKGLVDRQEVM